MLPLLSLNTEIFFWLSTLALLCALILLWHKVAQKKFTHLVIRITSLLLLQILAITSVLLTINRTGEFYSSWGDLFGSKSNLSKIAINSNSLAEITQNDIDHARRTPMGSLIIHKVITGEHSGISDVVYLVLSPKIAQAFKASNTPTLPSNYQIVELFSGYPGVPQTWIGALHGIDTIEQLESQGQIRPTISIIPNINVVPALDSECVNIPNVAQVETWLSDDMHRFAKRFLGIDNRKWSTFGYSTGGWCASQLAIRHPHQYARAVSLAGYFSPSFENGISKALSKKLISQYDLLSSIRTSTANPSLLVIASKADRYYYKAALKFVKESAPYLSAKFVEIPSGGHNLQVWHPYVETGMLWINEQSGNGN